MPSCRAYSMPRRISTPISLSSFISSSPVPAPPAAARLAHDELEVTPLEPRQLLGEHRHALLPGAGHLADVGAPGHPVRPNGVVALPQIGVQGRKRIGLARIMRDA